MIQPGLLGLGVFTRIKQHTPESDSGNPTWPILPGNHTHRSVTPIQLEKDKRVRKPAPLIRKGLVQAEQIINAPEDSISIPKSGTQVLEHKPAGPDINPALADQSDRTGVPPVRPDQLLQSVVDFKSYHVVVPVDFRLSIKKRKWEILGSAGKTRKTISEI
jgi:hypothetical protein